MLFNKYSKNVSLNNTNNNIKEAKSFIIKTGIKENKFKSPLIKNSRRKINDLVLDENNKKIRIRLKKDNKNSLSNSINSEIKTESNILKKNKNKDNIFVIKKKILNNKKNKNLTKDCISIKNSKKKINNMKMNTNILSSTRNQKKTDCNTMTIESIIKKRDKSYEKDSLIINNNNTNSDDSESENSEKTNEDKNDDDINNEIDEMNDIEEEIKSIIGQIKEFKKDLS